MWLCVWEREEVWTNQCVHNEIRFLIWHCLKKKKINMWRSMLMLCWRPHINRCKCKTTFGSLWNSADRVEQWPRPPSNVVWAIISQMCPHYAAFTCTKSWPLLMGSPDRCLQQVWTRPLSEHPARSNSSFDLITFTYDSLHSNHRPDMD